MNIGKRLRTLREARGLSQGDVERRSGLLRSYISRVEGGYTAPSLATLEKFAEALNLESYQLLYDHEGRPKSSKRALAASSHAPLPKAASRLVKLYEKMPSPSRRLLLQMAEKLSRA